MDTNNYPHKPSLTTEEIQDYKTRLKKLKKKYFNDSLEFIVVGLSFVFLFALFLFKGEEKGLMSIVWMLPIIGFGFYADENQPKLDSLSKEIKGIEQMLESVNITELKLKEPISLFLRCFDDDDIPIEYFDVAYIAGAGIKVPNKTNIETVIARILREFNQGDLVAAANPNQYIQALGSKLVYLPNDKWELFIKDYIQKAKLIFVIPRSTDGLIAELKYIIDLNCLNKVIFILPDHLSENTQIRLQELIENPKLKETILGNLQITQPIPNKLCLGVFEGEKFYIEKLRIWEKSRESRTRLTIFLRKAITRKLSKSAQKKQKYVTKREVS
jgi:hypothetical protein